MNDPRPNEDGRYQFAACFGTAGVPDQRIWAKTSKEAKDTLMWYLYNEMGSYNDDLIADD